MGALEKLSANCSYKSVAHEFGISASTAIRLFNNIQYCKSAQLPEVIGIDEFKDNGGGEKFHGILIDIGEKSHRYLKKPL